MLKQLLFSSCLSHCNSVHPSVCLSVHLFVRPSHGWNEIGPRLLLITNRKSYTGSRLAPNSMTLNDLERQNWGFYEFFGDFGLRHKSVIHKVAPHYCRYAIQIENLVFVY